MVSGLGKRYFAVLFTQRDCALKSKNMFQNFVIAFCLMLIIEGMFPFIAPGQWRALVLMLRDINDNQIRLFGLLLMLVGTALLLVVN